MSSDVHLGCGYFKCFSSLYFFHVSPSFGLFYSSLTSALMQTHSEHREKCVRSNFLFPPLGRRTRWYSNSLWGFGSLNVPVTFNFITRFLPDAKVVAGFSDFFFFHSHRPIYISVKAFPSLHRDRCTTFSEDRIPINLKVLCLVLLFRSILCRRETEKNRYTA